GGGMMAGRAASHADSEARDRLKAEVSETRDAFETGDLPEWRQHTSEFHALVASASGNHILDLFGLSLKELYSERLEHRVVGKTDRPTVLAEHAAIANAIIRRRPA